MRESLQRQRGPWRFNESHGQRNTPSIEQHRINRGGIRCLVQLSRIAGVLLGAVLFLPVTVFAQQGPWERAALNLEQTFTGPLARSLALVAIVIGGLMFMFGEGGAKRQISGIVFGGGLALFAAQFLTWLF